ncbi:DNA-nicking endonuclease, Smr domain [Modicisalibacter ilicicola DSM 19980]|uniref:DNA-nicking endonuclease, Smr domain n=1 Tax=Modicisalibacter ilicicola DSM 19980 TaxID=1121942 RepID=A0A1M4XIE6_9GAMM|nr:DNA endonuclease SmrA [Halomonas ilicicola]SHE93334.1 DNA-nicking endonuclease, Smr domain [Halomonas ilicicola DSM 19980]
MNRCLDRDTDFSRLLGEEVRPLSKGRDKADIVNSPSAPSEAQMARRASAVEEGEATNFLTDEFVDLLPHHDPIEHRRDGIQIGVLERLRQGGYAPEARLYLIKLPVRQCRRELFAFLQDAIEHDLRCLLVVHGRGKALDSHANVVRSYVAKWLMQFDQVQAYASAQPVHGGIGATYVMLRKSERARARNRERQQKRRG